MFHRLGYVVLCILKPERAEVEHDKRQVFFSSLSSQQLSLLTLGVPGSTKKERRSPNGTRFLIQWAWFAYKEDSVSIHSRLNLSAYLLRSA